VPGAGARSACAWRSIFISASASPCKITTASDHVAPVHRNLPSSIRSAVMFTKSQGLPAEKAPGQRTNLTLLHRS
jgi:hypothetical protein